MIHDVFGGKIGQLCLAISFLSHLAELLSASFTVLFTIQRYAAVRYPLQTAVQRHSSPIASLFVILLFSMMFCSVLLHSNDYIDCHEELQLRWFIVDALVSFIIPFTLIFIFNILIINLIRRHARSPLTMTTNTNKPRSKHQGDSSVTRESFPMICASHFTRTSRHSLMESDRAGKIPLVELSSITKTDQRDRAWSNRSMETDFQANELSRVRSKADCYSRRKVNNPRRNSTWHIINWNDGVRELL